MMLFCCEGDFDTVRGIVFSVSFSYEWQTTPDDCFYI
ncbi:MAG: hypothetical protein JWR72_4053 [Flavisolibacter sp.]|nr:hypothetical protein [Flavisolibacter sp.]